jgi:phosphoglycerol geranylgeranyltransferase
LNLVRLVGRVHDYIMDRIRSGEKLHFTLIDPDRSRDLDKLSELADKIKSYGTDAFLVGGSLGITPEEADMTAKTLKETGLPVIIFPGNLNCITRYADAIMYMVLMNSMDKYYLIEAQVAAAPIIKKYGLETLPTAYIVVYGDTAVAHVGRVYPIPENKPEIALAYAWAAEMIGMRYVYLEAGSGASRHVPAAMVRMVKRNTELAVIVGGGIREPSIADEIARSGADIIVTGTIAEEDPDRLASIIRAVKSSSTSF